MSMAKKALKAGLILFFIAALPCFAQKKVCKTALMPDSYVPIVIDPNLLPNTAVEVEVFTQIHPNSIYLIEPTPDALKKMKFSPENWQNVSQVPSRRTDFLKFYFANFAEPHTRSISYLRVSRNATLTFTEITTIFGKTYEPGVYTSVDLSEYFLDQVEYLHYDTAKNFSGFELHVRKGIGQFTAGQIYLDTQKLLVALGLPKRAMHVHIVGSVLPEGQEWLSTQEAMAQTYFSFRNNLWAEMIDVSQPGGRGILQTKALEVNGEKYDGWYCFGTLLTSDYQNLFAELMYVPDTLSDSDFKMGWVGARGASVYQPEIDNLGAKWGMEARFPRPTLNQNLLAQFLDALQKDMVTRNFNPEHIDFDHWLKAVQSFHQQAKSVNGLYARSEDQLSEFIDQFKGDEHEGTIKRISKTKKSSVQFMKAIGYISPHHARSTNSFQTAFAIRLFSPAAKPLLDQTTLKFADIEDISELFTWTMRVSRLDTLYLFHNWALDPLFYNKPEKIQKIAKAQAKAIRFFARYIRENKKTLERLFFLKSGAEARAEVDPKLQQAVRMFIKESGLLDAYSIIPKAD